MLLRSKIVEPLSMKNRLTQKIATELNSNITGVKLWVSSDGTFNNVTQLGTAQPFGATASLSDLSSTTITTSGTSYYVSLDLGSSTGTVSATIAQTTDITASNIISTFSVPAALSSGPVALPVELGNFTAISDDSSATLTWHTSTEANNYGFDVERKQIRNSTRLPDGQDFEIRNWVKIGFVQGNGTSNAPHTYSFTDEAVAAGRYAYRLKQIDNNGAFKYYGEAEVVIAAPAKFSLGSNFPNPFNPSTMIRFSIPQSCSVTLKVYDMLGKQVASLADGDLGAGTFSVTWNAERAPSGVYFYRLNADSFSATKKLMLTR